MILCVNKKNDVMCSRVYALCRIDILDMVCHIAG